VNRIVRKHLGARRISFADQAETEEVTGMTSGGITPVGLPEDWPVLVDQAVATSELLVIGGGVRDAKLLVSGAELAALPGTEVLELRVG
jgi:prolyl-tRNA editing enzyme YbaK/EbsC (Cys-tRNA(Pro) deacylase)